MKKVLVVLTTLFILIIIMGVYIYYNVKPSITLNGGDVIIPYGDKYIELGYDAFIFNKNVSDSVKVKSNITDKVGEYTINYIVSNKYLKNTFSIKRNVKIVDNEKPTITLLGDEEEKYYVNDKYKEKGYTAVDNYDGDITSSVIVENNTDFSKKGDYEIVYKVKDSSLNETSVVRKIKVVEKPVVVTYQSTGTGKGVPILMYHYFYDESKGEEGPNSNYMEISDFEEQMKYLSENNYYFPSWDEVASFIDGKITLPDKSVVVTMDDGHASVFNYAYPILKKYNVKATAFIITSYGSTFTNYMDGTIEYQSHTHNMHRGYCPGGAGGIFRCIDYSLGLEDLNKSIEILGKNDVIAYPYGDVTDNILKITKDAGFKIGLTTAYGRAKKGMDRYRIPRVRMYQGISLSSYKEKVK